jgi:hypothetical protein
MSVMLALLLQLLMMMLIVKAPMLMHKVLMMMTLTPPMLVQIMVVMKMSTLLSSWWLGLVPVHGRPLRPLDDVVLPAPCPVNCRPLALLESSEHLGQAAVLTKSK